jgi:hypothetical protein
MFDFFISLTLFTLFFQLIIENMVHIIVDYILYNNCFLI